MSLIAKEGLITARDGNDLNSPSCQPKGTEKAKERKDQGGRKEEIGLGVRLSAYISYVLVDSVCVPGTGRGGKAGPREKGVGGKRRKKTGRTGSAVADARAAAWAEAARLLAADAIPLGRERREAPGGKEEGNREGGTLTFQLPSNVKGRII